MKTIKSTTLLAPAPSVRPLSLALALAFVSMTASADVTIDQQPLNTQKPIPPNIMFIMDDSGSMRWQHMPGTGANWASAPPAGLPRPQLGSVYLVNDLRLRAANINSQWYDPTIEYQPWYRSDGTKWPAADPTAAELDPSERITWSNSTSNRLTGTYDFRKAWTDINVTSTRRGLGGADDSDNNITNQAWRFHGFYVLNKDADYRGNANYRRYEFSWDSTAKKWIARYWTLKADGTNDASTNISSFSWPGGITRTVNEEVQNYVNWFSYYRLRASMAKAAASRVFSALPENNRLGFNTIWNRNDFRIPVGNDNGLFRGDNKKAWFDALFSSQTINGTPLRQSLDRAGLYFSDTGATGPYGPESGSSQLSCRQNFTIMTTDGYWNDGVPTRSVVRANNDGNDGTSITGIGGVTYKYIAALPFKDSYSDTLADVAMYYWKNDLTGLKNDVPTTPTNPAFWQHMRTFGVSIGEKGTLDPSADLKALVDGTKSWPQPGNDKQENIDDLWHAAVNSRGDFLVASNPEEFASALTESLAKIGSETRSAANGATSSSKLEEGSKVFFTEYTSGAWSGEIKAYELDPATGKFKVGSGWAASTNLPLWSTRKINFNDGSTQKLFIYGNLNTTQKAAMGSADHVDYLRGDRSKEKSLSNPSGIFRERASALADFVNSQLVSIGSPSPRRHLGATFTGADSYAAFVTSNKNRRPQLYVGGNGGMLHAIDAATGVEKYAFIPSSVINETLRTLTDSNYEHRYFVDGELTVADVYDGSWKTILVGSLGRGGKTLFALNVTNPDSVTFLWEKTASDIPALGNNIGRPIIAQVADNDWRVLVGNGPNGSGDEAQLIMLDVMTGAATTVSTGASGNNGLSGVSGWDSTGDGFADTAYAGDLNGNVWRFSNLGTSPSASLLFAAKDGGGNAQPIMAAPTPAINSSNGDHWVFFGTGRYLNQDDNKNTAVQTWYGLIDKGESVGSRSSLVQRKILSSGEIEGRAVRTLESGTVAELVGKNGWYIDFVSGGLAEGERMIAPNFFYGTALFGVTLIPEATDPCNPSGRGMLWGINPFTGARTTNPIFDVNEDGLFDENLDGEPPTTIEIDTPVTTTPPTVIVNPVTGVGVICIGDECKRFDPPNTGAERTSWREIVGN